MAMIGRKYQVGIGKEATRGTVVAPSKYLPLLDPPSIENKPEYVMNEQGIGVIANADGSDIVKNYCEGEINGKVGDDSIGYLLLGTMGTVATSTDLGAQLHNFTMLNNNTHPSFTLDIKNDVEQLAHALCMVNSYRMTAEIDNYVQYTVGFTGKKGVASTETPAYTADNEFIAKHITIKVADDVSGLAGASALTLSSMELGIEKDVEALFSFGSDEPSIIPNKSFSVEGNFEGRFENTDLKTLFEEGTQKAMSISVVNTGVTIGTTNPTITYTMPKVMFEGWDKSGGNNDIIMQNLEFKAYYDTTEASMIEVDLRNETASY